MNCLCKSDVCSYFPSENKSAKRKQRAIALYKYLVFTDMQTILWDVHSHRRESVTTGYIGYIYRLRFPCLCGYGREEFIMEKKLVKFGSYAIKRVAAGAHLPHLGFLNLRNAQTIEPTTGCIVQLPPLVQAQKSLKTLLKSICNRAFYFQQD